VKLRAVALALVAGLLAACAAKWTAVDKNSALAGESMCERIYSQDAATAPIRTYSRACVCALQASLAAHDAGRLVGAIECQQKREP
jgi:hypothetical protein